MADIFLSYNRVNKQIAQDFVDQIRRRFGYTVWWDQEMSGGENWIQEVNRQQSGAKATIVLWSGKCFSDDPDERGHVKNEVEWALTNKRVVVPLTIPPFAIPSSCLPLIHFTHTASINTIRSEKSSKRLVSNHQAIPSLNSTKARTSSKRAASSNTR